MKKLMFLAPLAVSGCKLIENTEGQLANPPLHVVDCLKQIGLWLWGLLAPMLPNFAELF